MRLGIIGYGNMGSAFAKALAGSIGKENITVYEINRTKKEEASKEGFGVAQDLYFLLQTSDLLLLAVKPKDMKSLLSEIKELVKEKLIVTIAAGLDIAFYEDILGKETKIIRLMPNIGVMVGKGTIAVTRNDTVSDGEFENFKNLFRTCGNLYEVPEELFNSFTALAGSGPAFVFEFIDALALAGVREGFPYEESLSIVLDLLWGSTALLKELGGNPNEWITRVTSPGGTTIEGIAFLERKGFKGIVIRCIEKTSEKAKKLKG